MAESTSSTAIASSSAALQGSYSNKELKAWSRQIEAYKAADTQRQQLEESLFRQVSELSTALQNARTDLNDETETRRRWRKRAEDAESRIANNQFAVVLIDGNSFIFEADAMRSGASGATEIAQTFLAEARSFIKARHEADMPEGFQILVYIFADLNRLEQALRESDTLTDAKALTQFYHRLTQSHPLISFLDCGPGKNAVELKMRRFYEVYIEDCHCRHTVLALDHKSEYFATLESYAEDEWTLSKTSLVKSLHGLPSEHNLPFTIAEFSSLETVPLISLENGIRAGPDAQESESPSVSDLRALSSEKNQSEESTVPAANASVATVPGSDINEELAKSASAHSNSSHGPSPNRSVNSKATSSASSNSASVRIQRVTKSAKGPTGRRQDLLDSSVVSGGPVQLQPQLQPQPSFQDAHHHAVSSAMHDWELAPSENIYVPPIDLTPWGTTDEISWADSMNETTNRNNKTAEADLAAHPAPSGSAWRRRDPARDVEQPTGSYWEHRKTYQRNGGNGYRPPTPSSDSTKTVWVGNSSGSQRDPATNGLSSLRFADAEKSSADVPIQPDICINRLGQRVDPPLPAPSTSDQGRYDLRTKTGRLCNEHQLRRSCRSGKCRLDHDPIDDGMMMVLRRFARRLPCSIGPACRRYDCFYGHTCPYRLTRDGCKNSKCAFYAKGMHDVTDLKVVETIPSL